MNQEKLMLLIQKANFALYDVKLFLDTHPNCQEALDYYQNMKKVKEKAMREYVENFGSLCAEDVENRDYWDWNDRPWPWEGGNC
ncbi:MAG: spore coat protein CotJB [Eubacterium sp.]|nr:spore coat protein CotJB [Eubacterium sp.]